MTPQPPAAGRVVRPELDEAFDYIVVGAGAAGCAVAARLAEDPATTVLLLEAGGPDRKPQAHIPAAFAELFRSDLDWNYDTEPQPGLGGRRIYWPRGRMLGGSTSMNAMMWVRGFAADYDRWAGLAGDEWSYRSLLPYFRRAERVQHNIDPDQGSGGAIHLQPQRDPRSHTATFLRAAEQAGYAVVPSNTALPDGFSRTVVSQRRGARFSAADGYLRPARGRDNLVVRTGALAERVLFADADADADAGAVATGTRTGSGSGSGSGTGTAEAIGVCYLSGGIRHTVGARYEVVLAGGAVNTPQLLQLSGIGPRDSLARFGIDTVVDAPEVGANLRDHLVSGLIVETAGATAGDTLFAARRPRQIADYLLRRRGMLTSNVAEAHGFVRTDPALELPDIEIIFAPVAFLDEGLVPPPAHALTIGAILLQPESSGTIRLRSADPLAAPAIDPGYLSDPAGQDRATLLAGLGVCEDLLQTPALRGVIGGRFVAPAGGELLDRTTRDEQVLVGKSHTLYHPTGTARMGQDAGSVVDPQLRVRGVRRLRVADASVMPGIIRGHTQAPAFVIGEKAADLLRSARASGALPAR